MDKLTVPAYAKVNLVLDVLGLRPDGYHEVNMVMQAVALADLVTVSRRPEGITLSSDRPDLPVGDDNLAFRAARLLLEHTGTSAGLHIHITKRIPVAAGLAGGSTDAAAVLLAANYLLELGLTNARLAQLGAKLGADVPFCLLGGTARATGIGERLSLLPAAPLLWLVLVKPDFGVSTRDVYRWFDQQPVSRRPDTGQAIRALEDRDAEGLISAMGNVLEPVTATRHPEVAVIIDELVALGARRAVMCGSGPTVFGIAFDRQHAEAMAAAFRPRYKEVFVTHTI